MFDDYQSMKFDFFLTRFCRADSFSAELFRLFYKADRGNQDRIGKGFPVHLKVFRDWEAAGDEREFFAEFLNKREDAQNDV